MIQTTQKDLKEYIRLGLATDISKYNFSQMKEFIRSRYLEKVKFTRNVYGITGGLLRDTQTGELFVIIHGYALMIF